MLGGRLGFQQLLHRQTSSDSVLHKFKCINVNVLYTFKLVQPKDLDLMQLRLLQNSTFDHNLALNVCAFNH